MFWKPRIKLVIMTDARGLFIGYAYTFTGRAHVEVDIHKQPAPAPKAPAVPTETLYTPNQAGLDAALKDYHRRHSTGAINSAFRAAGVPREHRTQDDFRRAIEALGFKAAAL